MLIRAEDGTVHVLEQIQRIQIGKRRSMVPSEDERIDAADEYVVQAFGPSSPSELTGVKTEEECKAVMERIMKHKEGNLDLTEPLVSKKVARVL